MSSVGYSGLLYRVSQKLKDLSKINQIFFSCRNAGLVAEDSESYNIQVNPGDNIAVIVMKLFSDLQEQDNLGIDNLENLRDLLKRVKEWSLIDEVDKFERQRNDFNTLLETFIPKLDELDNLEQLISLCADHISEDVKDDIKDVRSLFKELEKKKRLGFSRLAILKKILNETGEQELLDALMEFEKKWKAEEVAERRKEFEGEYLSRRQKKETQEGQGLKRFRPAATSKWQIGEFKGPVVSTAQRTEALEIPCKRRRRNSDSEIYCKARDEDTKIREKEQETFLGEEKYAFVHRYLEEAHETPSVVTLTSDSGHVTHETASELGMEDTPDDTTKLYLKDLSEKVTKELGERLQADKNAVRLVYKSFGITHPSLLSRMHTSGYRSFGIPEQFPSRPKIGDVFRLFPDTPLKLLKDVFEALQLFDLLELLEQPTKPLTARSLRIALTLDEMKKLGNKADRLTTYHSCAAVLIIAEDENDSDVIGIKTFFTDLDTESDVTIIQCRDLSRRQSEQIFMKLNLLFFDEEEENETTMTMKEKESIERAALTEIERWIQRKDKFSFFALFDLYSLYYTPLLSCLMKLVSGIPDKAKLLVSSGLISTSWELPELPEFLQVTFPVFGSQRLLLEILNNRWQTLDLISMMADFKRSAYVKGGRSTLIQDSLSSLLRFKRKEDLSLSHKSA